MRHVWHSRESVGLGFAPGRRLISVWDEIYENSVSGCVAKESCTIEAAVVLKSSQERAYHGVKDLDLVGPCSAMYKP